MKNKFLNRSEWHLLLIMIFYAVIIISFIISICVLINAEKVTKDPIIIGVSIVIFGFVFSLPIWEFFISPIIETIKDCKDFRIKNILYSDSLDMYMIETSGNKVFIKEKGKWSINGRDIIFPYSSKIDKILKENL